MSPLEQGKYASYLYYHGLLDGDQYLTLLNLEEDLTQKVWKKKFNTLYLLKIEVAKSNLLFSISNPSSKNERKLCLGRLSISWRSVISFIFMKLVTITKIPYEI